MPKPTNKYDRRHLQNLQNLQRQIDEIYSEAAQDAASIGAGVDGFNPERPFTFEDYPLAKRRVDSLMNALKTALEACIVNGIKSGWTLANNKNNELANRVFGKNVGRLTQAQYRRYYSNNESARDAFIQRKVAGLTLSDRIWNYTRSFKGELEFGIDLGLRGGLSAAEMSRNLRKFLKNPDMLFRRVRDEHGILHLSKRAQGYHPGRGVYRSSYMNARRLAATETNIAYRTSDHLRWQSMDFVVGIEIHLSNNHTCLGRDGIPHPFTDICDELAGKYPKDFKFTGWHPHCRCFATSILKTDEEIAEDNKKILNGEEVGEESVNRVNDVPDAFKEWISRNEERMQSAAGVPYFLSDNPKYTGVQPDYGATGAVMGTKLGREATKEALMAYEDAKPPTLSEEQQSNINDIAAAMGTTATPMTFLEANDGKGNVDYSKGGAYSENCQSCVAVHEARLRGLDITALGYDRTEGSVSYNLGEHFEKAWISPRTGKAPQVTLLKGETDEKLLSKMERQASAVGRYHVGVNFRNGAGHVITAERLKTGEIVYYDAQNGKFLNIRELAGIEYLELLKVDKLLLNEQVLPRISKVIK